MDIEPSGVDDPGEGADLLESEEESSEPTDSFFFNIRVPVWKYVIRMWLIAFVPSVAIAFLLHATGVLTESNEPDLGAGLPPAVMFLAIVVISPVVETLLMCVVLKLLSFITKRRYALAVMSCLIWAGFHSLASPPWGLSIVWPFFIFSCSYLGWRRRSWWHAVLVTSWIHAMQNLLPGILLLVAELQEKGW